MNAVQGRSASDVLCASSLQVGHLILCALCAELPALGAHPTILPRAPQSLCSCHGNACVMVACHETPCTVVEACSWFHPMIMVHPVLWVALFITVAVLCGHMVMKLTSLVVQTLAGQGNRSMIPVGFGDWDIPAALCPSGVSQPWVVDGVKLSCGSCHQSDHVCLWASSTFV